MRRRLILRLALAVLFLLAFGARPAAAQTCTLTVTALSFGTYTGSVLNGTATGKVVCAGAWDIPLNAGTGAGASETTRYMTGPGGAELAYQVFQDAARTINWGNTTDTELTGTGNANPIFYGQIAAGQYAAPGTYTDLLSTSTTSFNVTATIVKDCGVSATSMVFGNYTGAVNNSTSTVTVTCTNTTAYTVGLSPGLATGATVATRKMQDGANLLNYALYSNSGRTTIWGNTAGTNWVGGTGSGVAQPLTVYGQIPAAQHPTPGSYTDTITATVTY
jgi:spore coat protein U-like protein